MLEVFGFVAGSVAGGGGAYDKVSALLYASLEVFGGCRRKARRGPTAVGQHPDGFRGLARFLQLRQDFLPWKSRSFYILRVAADGSEVGCIAFLQAVAGDGQNERVAGPDGLVKESSAFRISARLALESTRLMTLAPS